MTLKLVDFMQQNANVSHPPAALKDKRVGLIGKVGERWRGCFKSQLAAEGSSLRHTLIDRPGVQIYRYYEAALVSILRRIFKT
jgi:hypothetical protein